MKSIFLAILTLIVLGLAQPIGAQESASTEERQLLALVRDIQAQQGQIADNQTRIESKLADLVETIRVARIFAGKAGK